MPVPSPQPEVLPLDWRLSPRQVLRAWPADRPLTALWSHAPSDAASQRWSRWTILAEPIGGLSAEFAPARGRSEAIRLARHGDLDLPLRLDHGDPFRAIADHAHATFLSPSASAAGDLPPFRGGWIGSLSYELGHLLEPTTNPIDDPKLGGLGPPWPRMLWLRCPAAYIHDNQSNRWYRVASAQGLPLPFDALPPPEATPNSEAVFSRNEHQHGEYERSVARAVEYIHAGDIFQVNLSRPFSGSFHGSTREAFLRLCDAAEPWYGAYMESPSGSARRSALLSCSPELFLQLDPATRLVTTRPIKGTTHGDGDERRFAESPKDRAELAMIVDLMRNDLGRVCEYGSVQVTAPRELERHAAGESGRGVLHGVATIQGRLRPGLTVEELLRATFPGGSITGAPKVRAMQIIKELEGIPRGPYTGSIGYISDCGSAAFNIAIRTALLAGRRPTFSRGRLDQIKDGRWVYPAGAGIVADSVPAIEREETSAKAEFMLRLASMNTPNPVIAVAAQHPQGSAT